MARKKKNSGGPGWRYILPPALAGVALTMGVAVAMTATDH